jgi:hypothetical protein
MLMASAPPPGVHTFLQEVSLADGALLRTPGPAGGIELFLFSEYLGRDGDLLVTTSDISASQRLNVIRHDDPQTLAPVGSDLDYFGLVFRQADADGTNIAISVALAGMGRFRAFLCDANLPAVSTPLGTTPADDEDVYVAGALGTPLP